MHNCRSSSYEMQNYDEFHQWPIFPNNGRDHVQDYHFFPLETHHRLYQASCPSGDETTIPQESDHNQHRHRQHISQPNKFLGQDTSILQGIQ